MVVMLMKLMLKDVELRREEGGLLLRLKVAELKWLKAEDNLEVEEDELTSL